MLRPRPGRCLLYLCISLCCLASSVEAQVTCTPVFTQEYQANSNVAPTAVKVLTDGTMLVAGSGVAAASGIWEGWVARLNPNGSQIWSFFIGGGVNDVFSGICPLSDGTIVLYGSTKSFGHPEGQGWLVHIDNTGAVLSSFVLGSSTTVNGWVKAVEQYTDGDVVGSFNINDGSAASDPVVFKLGLDGTLRWASRFDNGNDDSFTGVAFSGDTLYASGYYTGGGNKQGVITMLNVTNGSVLSSSNISYLTGFQEQIVGLQIYGGMISYGLYMIGSTGGNFNNAVLLTQTDLAGNLLHPSTYASDAGSDLGGSSIIEPIRTADSGFYVMRTAQGVDAGPGVAKINKYGVEEWGVVITPGDDYSTMDGIDVTADGGCVAVGWFQTYLTYYTDIMRLVRITASGEVSSCNLAQESMATGIVTLQQQTFTWASQPAISTLVQAATPNPSTAAPMTPLADPENPNCSGSVCVDNTPIPAGCNKTYNIAYSTDRSSAIYDIIPTTDGGRLAVGGLVMPTTYQSPSSDGLVIKYQSDGDVAWAKNYNFAPGYDLDFTRVVMLADGNMLAIGNIDYDLNYGLYQDIVLMKFDINGNVLWVNSINEAQMNDIGATPDGGFILLSGSTVIRYDGNANMVWQRYTTHASNIPVYLSVFCSGNYVDIAYHSQIFSTQFGVDRLNLQTGAEVWSNSYSTSSTSNAISKIITIRDSVYLFMYNYIQYAAAPVTNLVVQFDTLGNFYQAQTLGAADGLNVTINPPTVTLTSDGNFALTSELTASNSLLLTKLQPNGVVVWSNNFTSIPYMPTNLHTQGKGFIIPGIQSILHTGNPNFTNSIIVKLDSSGQFEEGAAAGCQATPHSFIVSPYTGVSPSDNPLSSDVPTTVPVTGGSVYSQNAAVSPTLLCYAPGNCNAVNMLQKGSACTAGDTLVYYLDNSSNCGAAATWNYDPTLFRPGITSGDSIQLIVLQGGSSTVSAQVEGYCSLTLESIPANISLSTTTLSLGPDTVVCDNSSVTLTATPGFVNYLWDNSSTGTSLVVTAPGTYYVAAADQCGGQHSDTVLVTAADSLFHLTSDTTTCNEDPIVLHASGGYTDYQWSPAYNIQQQDSLAVVTPGITTRYIVTAQRWPGCNVTRSELVTALLSPPISLGNDTSICSGDSLLLDAGTVFNSYQWSTGAMGERIYISQAGTYSVAALYSNGCTSRDTVQLVSLYTVAQPALDQDSVLCLGTDRVLNAGPGYASYFWNNGNTGSSIDISQTGVYWVAVTDSHGCEAADTTHVTTTAAPPKGFLPPDTTVCQYGGLVINTLEPFVSYSWSDLSTGSSLRVNQPGVYWVTVMDANGCTGKDSIAVTGKECLIGLFVPNAFTPNGDGHNDRFKPLLYGDASNFGFEVFNRWGQRVFATQSSSMVGWDGTINGTPCPPGTYVWYCRYQIDGQPEALQKGTVILIR